MDTTKLFMTIVAMFVSAFVLNSIFSMIGGIFGTWNNIITAFIWFLLLMTMVYKVGLTKLADTFPEMVTVLAGFGLIALIVNMLFPAGGVWLAWANITTLAGFIQILEMVVVSSGIAKLILKQ